MKKILCAFKPFFSEISHDLMLIACIVGPIFMGVAFRFAIPIIEKILCEYLEKDFILEPYYAAFDMLLVIMTPILFCFAGIFVILEEIDFGTAKYYSVTPLGKRGYLISRIGIPAVISFFYAVVLLYSFKLSDINSLMIILLSVCGMMISVVIAIFIITFAKNRMEGLALSKMCGLLVLGIPVAYSVTSPVRYFFAVLPTFWMSELCITGNLIYFPTTVIVDGVMIFALCGKFNKKMI